MPPANGRVCVQCNLSQCFIKSIWIISNRQDQFVGLQMTSALSLLAWWWAMAKWLVPSSQELARGLQVEMLSHGLAQGCLSLESSCHHQQLLLLLLCLHIHVCTWSLLNPHLSFPWAIRNHSYLETDEDFHSSLYLRIHEAIAFLHLFSWQWELHMELPHTASKTNPREGMREMIWFQERKATLWELL